MVTESTGIEFFLISAWEGWEEHGVSDLYFYNVTLRPEVFGEEFIKQYEGKRIDIGMWLQTSTVDVYVDGENDDEPVLSKKLKLVLGE